MSQVGKSVWFDLSVPHEETERIRDFYRDVVGWTVSEVDMRGYHDYAMHAATGEPVAGVCHAIGVNADLPAQWLVYVNVADIEASVLKCTELGGEVIVSPRSLGQYGIMAVIRDPAGAVMTLIQPPPK